MGISSLNIFVFFAYVDIGFPSSSKSMGSGEANESGERIKREKSNVFAINLRMT